MTTNLRDREVLLAVSPLALSAYARVAGWSRSESFGDYSDVYAGSGLPEIIIPRTQRLGDYAQVVAHLISIFAQVADVNEVILYNDLVVADRDVTRVRVNVSDVNGSIRLEQGPNLVSGARDMLLAAACSLHEPRPVYRVGANKEANDYLRRVRLGQTEQGSFVVALLSPVIPPPVQEPLWPDLENYLDPLERRVTRRLTQALSAVHEATAKTMTGDAAAFTNAVAEGISANLCEALAKMLEPYEYLDVSTTWAQSRPMQGPRHSVQFSKDDTVILLEAARSFRSREPRLDVTLFGSVQRLKRDDSETDGTVTLRTHFDGRIQSVTAVLSEFDYDRAIVAHRDKAPVIVEGDLDRFGQRWRLLNPRIAEVISGEDEENEVEDVQSGLHLP